jgi:hypothetical protein
MGDHSAHLDIEVLCYGQWLATCPLGGSSPNVSPGDFISGPANLQHVCQVLLVFAHVV